MDFSTTWNKLNSLISSAFMLPFSNPEGGEKYHKWWSSLCKVTFRLEKSCAKSLDCQLHLLAKQGQKLGKDHFHLLINIIEKSSKAKIYKILPNVCEILRNCIGNDKCNIRTTVYGNGNERTYLKTPQIVPVPKASSFF